MPKATRQQNKSAREKAEANRQKVSAHRAKQKEVTPADVPGTGNEPLGSRKGGQPKDLRVLGDAGNTGIGASAVGGANDEHRDSGSIAPMEPGNNSEYSAHLEHSIRSNQIDQTDHTGQTGLPTEQTDQTEQPDQIDHTEQPDHTDNNQSPEDNSPGGNRTSIPTQGQRSMNNEAPLPIRIHNLSGTQCRIADITNLDANSIRATQSDPEVNLLEAECVYSLLCFWADLRYGVNTLVISPRYSQAGFQQQLHLEYPDIPQNVEIPPPSFQEMIDQSKHVPFSEENDTEINYTEVGEMNLYYGNLENFDIVLIPVAQGAHFTLAIYEKDQHRIIYTDSIPDIPMMPEIQDRLFSLIHEINPSRGDDPIITIPARLNRQSDEFECGIYTALSGEGYLLYGNTYNPNLQFRPQFTRLINILLALSEGRYPHYTPRNIRERIPLVGDPSDTAQITDQSPMSTNLRNNNQSLMDNTFGVNQLLLLHRDSDPRTITITFQSNFRR